MSITEMIPPVTTTPTIEVGDMVVKTAYPQIEVGTVLALDGDRAYLVGRRVGSAEWQLIACEVASLAHLTPGAVESPDLAAIGQALVAKHKVMEEAMSRQRVDIETLRVHNTDLTDQHERFKTQVRDLAIEKAVDENWCDDGLNNALRELGLTPKSVDYRVPVDVRATQTVYVTVSATSEDDAVAQVNNYSDSEILNQVSSYDWSIDDDWEVDTYGVEVDDN